jgi:hypothetical protein
LELMLKINVGENPSAELISRLVATAASLDQPPVLRKVSVGEVSSIEYPANGNAAVQAFHEMVEQGAEGATEEGEAENDSDDAVTLQSAIGAVTLQPTETKTGKRGRPSKADIEARKAAEVAAAQTITNAQAGMAQPQPTAVHTPTPTPVPSGMTLPPGVTMAQTQPTLTVVTNAQQPTPTITPTPAALPAVPPAAQQPTPDGVVPLEVFKQAYMEVNTRVPGKPFIALKATTWPDGSPKQGWFTAEGVPPEYREKLLEIWSTL